MSIVGVVVSADPASVLEDGEVVAEQMAEHGGVLSRRWGIIGSRRSR
jgi:hypothetical protein